MEKFQQITWKSNMIIWSQCHTMLMSASTSSSMRWKISQKNICQSANGTFWVYCCVKSSNLLIRHTTLALSNFGRPNLVQLYRCLRHRPLRAMQDQSIRWWDRLSIGEYNYNADSDPDCRGNLRKSTSCARHYHSWTYSHSSSSNLDSSNIGDRGEFQ